MTIDPNKRVQEQNPQATGADGSHAATSSTSFNAQLGELTQFSAKSLGERGSIIDAAKFGNLERVKLLLDQGFKIDSKNRGAGTILMFAAGSG